MFATELDDYGLLHDAIRRCRKLPADDVAEVLSLETAAGPTFCITYLMGVLDGFAHRDDSKRHHASPTLITTIPDVAKGGPK
ncbi:Hypothetical protein GLP15_4177 [Giardia lamblia P15]|uniref:Uncharacterized protein n=1 Tax=Giardia intestinalis (strain P15) TaxID=658858 RepID=E1EYE7_GIAIA|nr:Hypothetical protein GLP15_4177 [Giardia lamblia P15]